MEAGLGVRGPSVRGGTESRSSLSPPLSSQGRAERFPAHKSQRLFVDAEQYFLLLFLLMERLIQFTEHIFVGKHNGPSNTAMCTTTDMQEKRKSSTR